MYNLNKSSPKREIVKALHSEGFDAPDDAATRDDLLVLLGQITGDDYTKLSAAKTVKVETATAEAAPARRTIVIPSGDTKLNQGDVFVGFNGVGYQLQRDVEVEVPEVIINVLRAAKTTIGRQMDHGSVEYHKIPTYPFQVVN